MREEQEQAMGMPPSKIETPPSHKVVMDYTSDDGMRIVGTKCGASECRALHLWIEYFTHVHTIIYAPDEEETLEDACAIIFASAKQVVMEFAMKEATLAKACKHVN